MNVCHMVSTLTRLCVSFLRYLILKHMLSSLESIEMDEDMNKMVDDMKQRVKTHEERGTYERLAY